MNYTPQHGGSYRAPTAPASTGWGSAGDWASIISGLGQGASKALETPTSAIATNTREAKEAKRRTLANLLNAAMKRNQGLFRLEQENAGETTGTQTDAMQQMARGFVSALQGST